VADYVSPMRVSDRKELFGYAFVRAVASMAGFTVSRQEIDRESVDLKIAGDCTETETGPQLDVQVKCTSQDVIRADSLRFRLKVKNYNDLRKELVMVPRLLIVVCVPDALGSWLIATEFKTILKHSGYWISLRGWPETGNEGDLVTVPIPRVNRFTPSALAEIMARISKMEKL
jgi:Domain of unknown function (DUF4365)